MATNLYAFIINNMSSNQEMKNEFTFNFTKDKSVGLYNSSVSDVYHSIYGARAEAEEKFIKPLNFKKNFCNKKSLNVLDICYGIGYNTKALINEITKCKYTGKTNIDIVEYDMRLPLISPFIKDTYFDTCPDISYIILSNLYDEIINNKNVVETIVNNYQNKSYFTPFYLNVIKKYQMFGYKYYPDMFKKRFLHNIYYHCISQRTKRQYKRPRNKNISIKCHFDDARKVILALNKTYDIIFLDAFTPTKLPTLWSYDFFNALYSKLDKDSLLITYSNSVAVRKAMLDCGFYVGKLYDKNKRCCGTCCSKNDLLIENKLSDYDIGLMNTGAGVYYRDANLLMSADEIIEEHAIRKSALNLQSSSSFIKEYKRTISNNK